MKLYDEIYKLAEELEKGRFLCLRAIQQIKENKMYTEEGKKELTQKVLNEYYIEIDKANNTRLELIDKFIKNFTPEKAKINVKELNEVLKLIKGLSIPLSDLELLEVTEKINNNFATMEVFKRELNSIHWDELDYPETFKNLETKRNLFEKIEEFEKNRELEKSYFKKDINLTCVKYSLETLKTWEEEILNLSK